MNYIYKTDNYDEQLKEDKLTIFLKPFVITRAKLRQEFISNNEAFIDGTESLNESVINRDFDDNIELDDIVLVHVTNEFPHNGIVKPAKDKVLDSYDGHKVLQHRFTTHFALNGRVGNNDGGNWDNQKIIVIDPLVSHIKDVANINPADTYFDGDVKLSDKAIIMIDESIYDTIPQELITKYNIVKFRGKNTNAVNKMLLILGYKPQNIDANNWVNRNNSEILNDYMSANYPQIKRGVHHGSLEHSIEKKLQRRDLNLARIRDCEFIDTTNGIGDISLEELKKLYLENYTTESKEIDFELFTSFCIHSGIMTNIHDEIIFLNDIDTLKIVKNKNDFLKNNLYCYRQLFEAITKMKFLDNTHLNTWYENYKNKYIVLLKENNITQTDEEIDEAIISAFTFEEIYEYNNYYYTVEDKDAFNISKKYSEYAISLDEKREIIKKFIEERKEKEKIQGR